MLLSSFGRKIAREVAGADRKIGPSQIGLFLGTFRI